MDYTEVLRRLSINDERFVDAELYGRGAVLDPKPAALARLAALIAVGGAVSSYGALADAAVDAGATVAEIVDVLVEVIPVVGLPRVVAAAPRLAMALEYDLEEAMDSTS